MARKRARRKRPETAPNHGLIEVLRLETGVRAPCSVLVMFAGTSLAIADSSRRPRDLSFFADSRSEDREGRYSFCLMKASQVQD